MAGVNICNSYPMSVDTLVGTIGLCVFEPRHDKTNKVSVRPAKTQISLGIRPI